MRLIALCSEAIASPEVFETIVALLVLARPGECAGQQLGCLSKPRSKLDLYLSWLAAALRLQFTATRQLRQRSRFRHRLPPWARATGQPGLSLFHWSVHTNSARCAACRGTLPRLGSRVMRKDAFRSGMVIRGFRFGRVCGPCSGGKSTRLRLKRGRRVAGQASLGSMRYTAASMTKPPITREGVSGIGSTPPKPAVSARIEIVSWPKIKLAKPAATPIL